MNTRYQRNFSLSEKDELEFQTCLAKFTAIEILRAGIKECLKHCPKPPEKLVNKVKELVK